MAGAGTLALAVRTPGSVPGSSWTAWRRHAPLGGPCVLPPGLPLGAETLPPPRRGALGVHSFCQMRLGPGHSMPRQALGPLPLPDGSGALPFLDGVVVWAPTITRRSRDSCDVPSIYYEGLGPCPSLLGWTGIPTICQEVSGLIPPGSRVPYRPQEGSEPHPFPQVLVRVHLSQPGGPSPQRSVWSLHPSPVGSGPVSPCLGQREVLSLLQEGPKHFPKGRRWPGYLPSAMRSQSPDPPRWCGRGVSSYCQRGRGPVPPHCGGYRFLFL